MIINFENLSEIAKENTVYIPGCFDLFHRGHLELFKSVRNKYLNYKIIIGVMSNEFIINHKKKEGPVIDEKDRLEIIDACKYVDYVFICPYYKENYLPHQYLNIKNLKPNYVIYNPSLTVN